MTTQWHEERIAAVLDVLRAVGARTVLDLGCGDGACVMPLVAEPGVERIVGVDQSAASLRGLRGHLAGLPPSGADKVELVHGSITDMGRKYRGFDAAVLVETIEHIEPNHLSRLERTVFQDLSPETIIISTPNADFNALLGVPGHRYRHPDHRFEWGRAQFEAWTGGIGRRNGYAVQLSDVAGLHPDYGGASQMAVFSKRKADEREAR